MKLLVDTDAFCKLGVAEFLPDAANIFNASLQECGRLPALPYMLRKGVLRNRYGAEACDALISMANTMPMIQQPGFDWLDKLTAIPDIDPGEAQIFAAAAESGLIIVSGDKRALRALRNVGGFADVLAGRIVVLEAVLLALCDRVGPEKVRQQIAPLIALDKVVEVCFSPSGGSDPREGLESYYRAVVADVEPLALWKPQKANET